MSTYACKKCANKEYCNINNEDQCFGPYTWEEVRKKHNWYGDYLRVKEENRKIDEYNRHLDL